MLIFEHMLTPAAEQAGIAVPPVPDQYVPTEFPHWHVLCLTQLQRPMSHGEHWDNAKALALIPAEKLQTITFEELQAAGCNCGV